MAEIAGLKLIVPSSVAAGGGTATLSASGKITLSSVTASLTVEDIFSATYDNYLIVIRSSVSSGSPTTVNMRLRVGGSDASGNNYVDQYQIVDGAGIAAGRQGPQSAFINLSTADQQRSGGLIYLFGPYLAQPTAVRGLTMAGHTGGYIRNYGSTHSLGTSYTGLSFFPPAAITGAMTIYGLSQ